MEKLISSDRIYLKKLNAEDISEDVMIWFKDTDLMQYYTNSRSEITKEKLLNSLKEGEKNKNNYTFGIFFTESDDLIGTIKLGPINRYHRTSDLVVLIGNKSYHRKGLAVEAIKLGNKLAFEVYDLRKLYGGMYESNIGSIKAYTKAGWVIEGRLKGQFLVNEKPEDRILVACFNPKYFESE